MPNSPEDATAALVAKLTNPRATFNSAQVAFLMSTAGRWGRESVDEEPGEMTWRAGYLAGYWSRVREENDAYPPQPFDIMPSAREETRRIHRSRALVDQRHVRPEDLPGRGAGPES